MLEFLKKEANKTYTENGAATYVSTQSDCLDLFATIGALRNASEEDIITRFTRAYAEDADLAMKMLFFARDIRGGLGERRVFKVIFKYLAAAETESVKKNIENVAEYGRYDDLMALLDTPVEKEVIVYIEKTLKLYIISDMEFDCCARNSGMTNFENAKAEFARYGYKLPQIVFWNVNSRNQQQPVKMNDQGVALVSGCNPQIFSMLKEDNLEPYKFMMSVLSATRYERIAA